MKTLAGKKLGVSSPQGRFQSGASLLDGQVLRAIEAFGKHLFYQFGRTDNGPILHVHLGLFGRYKTHKRTGHELPEVRGATRVRMVARDYVVDLNGPNQCEVIEHHEMQAIVGRLGPDPLRADADPRRARERIQKSRASIGQLLMDQSVMAGIGNIYRTELLFRADIDPLAPGCTISRQEFDRLWRDAVKLLNIGVKYNRIITVDLAKIDKPATRLRYGEKTLIFGKRECPRCGGPITRFEIANRRAFRCDVCQPSRAKSSNTVTLDSNEIETG